MNRFVIFFMLAGSAAFAHPGIGIVEDSMGNIFYTDLKQVWKIDLNGTISIAVKNVHSHELFIDENDNLFGEHLWYNGDASKTWGHFVWRYSSDGKYEKIIPDKEGFLKDYSFVRDHIGNMYWADRTAPCQKLIKRSKNNSITKMSKECFHNIRTIKSTPAGDVYLVDDLDLKHANNQGGITTIAKKITHDNPNSLMGIWNDQQKNIYIASFDDRSVKRFTAQGKEEIAATISSPWAPTGGLVDKDGNLWVLEYNLNNAVRVERILKSGARKIF